MKHKRLSTLDVAGSIPVSRSLAQLISSGLLEPGAAPTRFCRLAERPRPSPTSILVLSNSSVACRLPRWNTYAETWFLITKTTAGAHTSFMSAVDPPPQKRCTKSRRCSGMMTWNPKARLRTEPRFAHSREASSLLERGGKNSHFQTARNSPL